MCLKVRQIIACINYLISVIHCLAFVVAARAGVWTRFLDEQVTPLDKHGRLAT